MRLEHAYGWALPMTVLGMGPGSTYIEVGNGNLLVDFGWSFRLETSLSNIESARREQDPVPLRLGIGVHGWGGEWAANATRNPDVVVRLKDPQKTRILGFPVKVRVFHLCPALPETFLAAIGPRK